ncbi:MAG: hypothetical protein QM572_01285 [Nocardioides sp.]|uniref:hypothetical protein n=1 Tax=Nocardioides sp. TaxID=35761 RepID=UPI0039E6A9B0
MPDRPLLIPRPNSVPDAADRAEEEEFHALVESIETLLFTSSEDPDTLDRAVLAQSMAELEARWPAAAAELAPRIAARGQRAS